MNYYDDDDDDDDDDAKILKWRRSEVSHGELKMRMRSLGRCMVRYRPLYYR